MCGNPDLIGMQYAHLLTVNHTIAAALVQVRKIEETVEAQHQ